MLPFRTGAPIFFLMPNSDLRSFSTASKEPSFFFPFYKNELAKSDQPWHMPPGYATNETVSVSDIGQSSQSLSREAMVGEKMPLCLS